MTMKTIKIGDKDYSVPKLVPRQLRIVMPALVRLMPLATDFTKMTTALYDDMLLVLYWGAVWPNDKESNISSLMDVEIPFDQMQAALMMIREQSGLFNNVALPITLIQIEEFIHKARAERKVADDSPITTLEVMEAIKLFSIFQNAMKGEVKPGEAPAAQSQA